MNKKTIITISTILGLTIIVGGFLILQKTRNQGMINKQQKQKIEIVKNNENESKQDIKNQKKDNQNNQEKVEELKIEDIDTSNWKTYRSEICGIEFSYPDSYHLQVFNEDKNICNVRVSKMIKSNPGQNVELQYITTFVDKESFLDCDPVKVVEYDSEGQIEWLSLCDHQGDNLENNYKYLIDNKCEESNIFLANYRELMKKDGEHEISISCETGNIVDAKNIKGILRSFKFIPKE